MNILARKQLSPEERAEMTKPLNPARYYIVDIFNFPQVRVLAKSPERAAIAVLRRFQPPWRAGIVFRIQEETGRELWAASAPFMWYFGQPAPVMITQFEWLKFRWLKRLPDFLHGAEILRVIQ